MSQSIERALELYYGGELMVEEIERQTGISPTKLWKYRKKHGLPARPKIMPYRGGYRPGDRDTFTCPMCSTEKPRSAFYKCSGRSSGIDSRCKPCKNILQKYRKRNNGYRTTSPDKRVKMGIKA